MLLLYFFFFCCLSTFPIFLIETLLWPPLVANQSPRRDAVVAKRSPAQSPPHEISHLFLFSPLQPTSTHGLYSTTIKMVSLTPVEFG